MSGWVLAISGTFTSHDLSFALLTPRGELAAIAEEERFTRVKHSLGALPTAHGLDWCLRHAGITVEQLDAVAVACDPSLFRHDYQREGYLAIERLFLESHGLSGVPVARYAHHLCHAASAYYPSPFEDAAVLSVDGQGERATCAIGAGRGADLSLLWTRDDESVGLLYTELTRWLGLGWVGDEGKTMGLAAYGAPRLRDVFARDIVEWSAEDGDFHLRVGYGPEDLAAVLGPPRSPGEPLTARHRDVAATAQLVVEEVMLGLARRAHRMTGARRLCVAGGVALNCVANARLDREGPFRESFIPPWPGDGGLAAGAALAHHHAGPGSRRAVARCSPHLGRSIPDGDAARAARSAGLEVREVGDPAEHAAAAVAEGRVVGWCQGRAEIGYRALGSRSILADARRPDMAGIVNGKVKFREPWRPFAPSVLEEDAGRYFVEVRPSPYMVTSARFRPEAAARFPSVVHVDGTGRLQTVSREANEPFHRLLLALRRLTGDGLVLNTSLNVRGEPIVDRAEDAIRLLLSTDLDVLVLGPYVLERPGRQLESVPVQVDRLRALRAALGANAVVLLPVDGPPPPGAWAETAASPVRSCRRAGLAVTALVDGPIAGWRECLAAAGAGRVLPVEDAAGAAAVCAAADLLLLALDQPGLFSPRSLPRLRTLAARSRRPGFLLVEDRTVESLDDVRPFADAWRQALVRFPPPGSRPGAPPLAVPR